MPQRVKSILRFVFDPRSLVFAFALFNFILIWTEARNLGNSGIACVVCPWYHPWSWFNEPTLLLVAALFVRLNRTWCYIVALILSGYLVSYSVRLFLQTEGTLSQEWAYLRKFYPYIVGSWHSQYLFALVTFCCSGFYLARGTLRREAVPSHGG